MDQGSADIFVCTVWAAISLVLFFVLRRWQRAEEDGPRLPAQLLGSVLGGAVVTAALLFINFFVTAGAGPTGSQM